jgi:hypothetical protein
VLEIQCEPVSDILKGMFQGQVDKQLGWSKAKEQVFQMDYKRERDTLVISSRERLSTR